MNDRPLACLGVLARSGWARTHTFLLPP